MNTRRIRPLVLVVLLAMMSPTLFPQAAAPPAGIEVTGPGHKVLTGPDEDGDLEISVKLTVKNTTESDLRVEVTVQAIDAEDFEVFEVRLSGTVKAKQSRVLTDSKYISEKLYKWQAEEELEAGSSPCRTFRL